VALCVLDTSVLIGADPVPAGLTSAISVASLAELHFGVLRARSTEQRAERLRRLGIIESRFPRPLAVDDVVARHWGTLMAAVQERGAQPGTRGIDLLIAATARAHGARVLTHNVKDFRLIDDLVEIAAP
jgi:predicted nucleic acid-binding protein